MSTLSSGGLRFGAACVATFGIAVVAPIACLFPSSYTFDLGTGGATASSSSAPTTTTTTTTGTMGGGGMSTTGSTGGATASTTTSTTTTSSGGTCPTQTCGDPTCLGYACVPAAPAGWTGYYELYDGPTAGAPSSCGGSYPTQAFLGEADLVPAEATCACSCGAPTGQTCTMTGDFTVTDAACGTTETCSAPLPTDWTVPCVSSANSPDLAGGSNFCGPSATNCQSGSFAPCNVSASVGPTTVSGGSCAASTVVATIPPPAWQSVGEACGGAAMANGCTGGAACLPNPGSGFGSTLCVMKAGTNTCTNPLFPNVHVFYTAATDTRSCSACGCGAPSGASCSGTIVAYASDTGCTGSPIATIAVDSNNGNCVALSGNPAVGARKATTTAPIGGTCAQTGGQAMGSDAADTTTAVTFCCQ